MFDRQAQNYAASKSFMGSIHLFANVAAGGASFFITPVAYQHSVGWVTQYVAGTYGQEFTGLAGLAWWIVLALLFFAISRATIATAIVVGGLAIAARLFV